MSFSIGVQYWLPGGAIELTQGFHFVYMPQMWPHQADWVGSCWVLKVNGARFYKLEFLAPVLHH